jgi:PKHD-type hydroxylase
MNKNFSSVWPFQIDKLETWAYYNSVFTKEECKEIIKIGNKNKLLAATVDGQKNKIHNIRKSHVSWIYPNPEIDWIYKRVADAIIKLNNDYFKFDIYGFIEGFQFTYYKSPGGKYGKHIDKGMNMHIRKLSLTIQLSDPSSYEGGNLHLHIGDKPIIIPKEQGKLIAFPSYVLHEVTPVTKGERYSLVAWLTGPSFK